MTWGQNAEMQFHSVKTVDKYLQVMRKATPFFPSKMWGGELEMQLFSTRGLPIKLANFFAPTIIFRVRSCIYILCDLTCQDWLKTSSHNLCYGVNCCSSVFLAMLGGADNNQLKGAAEEMMVAGRATATETVIPTTVHQQQ